MGVVVPVAPLPSGWKAVEREKSKLFCRSLNWYPKDLTVNESWQVGKDLLAPSSNFIGEGFCPSRPIRRELLQ